jgi:hypothetical protein
MIIDTHTQHGKQTEKNERTKPPNGRAEEEEEDDDDDDDDDKQQAEEQETDEDEKERIPAPGGPEPGRQRRWRDEW